MVLRWCWSWASGKQQQQEGEEAPLAWEMDNVDWMKVKGDDLIFADVGPCHSLVMWRSLHPCAQSASHSFRRCTGSNIPCLQFRSGSGVSHPSHSHKKNKDSLCCELILARASVPSAYLLPRFHQTSSCPKALDSYCSLHSTTVPGRGCCRWLSPMLVSCWGIMASCNPPPDLHLCSCEPGKANILPLLRLGKHRTCSVPVCWAVPSSITMLDDVCSWHGGQGCPC